jgi:L-lactate dehydrogenase (cytochrome)
MKMDYLLITHPTYTSHYIALRGYESIALALNKSAYNAILFRPRVMIDVDTVDTRTEYLGHKTSLPIFVAPAGMAKLRCVC